VPAVGVGEGDSALVGPALGLATGEKLLVAHAVGAGEAQRLNGAALVVEEYGFGRQALGWVVGREVLPEVELDLFTC
jgi:hypothetical protein